MRVKKPFHCIYTLLSFGNSVAHIMLEGALIYVPKSYVTFVASIKSDLLAC